MSGIILAPDFLEPVCSFGCDQKKKKKFCTDAKHMDLLIGTHAVPLAS